MQARYNPVCLKICADKWGTASQFYNTLAANEPIRKAWVMEKEKWALQEISKHLKKLNPAGQDEAVVRIEELTHSPRFKNLFDDDETLKK